MLLTGGLPEVASIALFSILRVSPTDIPTLAADSFDAAMCCNDKAKGSKAGAAAAGTSVLVAVLAVGFGAGVAAGFRLANEGRTLPTGAGLTVVGNLPRGCVPEPLAAVALEVVADLSTSLAVEVEVEGFVVDAVGETRLFFRLSTNGERRII